MRPPVSCAPVLIGGLVLALSLAAAPARAQVDSREGIALQNQILELRRELQDVERGGGGGASRPRPPARSRSPRRRRAT